MLPSTRDFTLTGCTVGARLVTYRQLEEYYRCNVCGDANITYRTQGDGDQAIHWAECAQCQARDFVSKQRYEQQIAEWPGIVAGLPDELRTALGAAAIVEVDRVIANQERDSAILADRPRPPKRLAPSTNKFHGPLFKTERPRDAGLYD